MIVCVFFLFLSCSSAITNNESGKPYIELKVDKNINFIPFDVNIMAIVHNIDENNPAFCHAEQKWIRKRTGSDSEEIISYTPGCNHPNDEVHVERYHYKVLHFGVPGDYKVWFELIPKDGSKPVTSFPVTVRALASAEYEH